MKSYLKLSIFLVLIILAVSSCSDKAVDYYNDGVDAATDNDIDTAIELWNKSLLNSPEDPDTYFNLGSAYFKKGDFVNAEQNFRNSLKFELDNCTTYYNLGRSLQKQGKLSEAKNNYKFAIKLKRNYLPPHLAIAECSLSEKQINTAKKYASMALKLSPGNIKANTYLAEAFFLNGQYNDAFLQVAPYRNSTNKNLLISLGKTMYKKNMYLEAIETLSKARSLGGSNSVMFLYLGKSSLELERFRDAKNYFKLSLFKNPDESLAWAGLGEVHASNNDWDKSVEAYSKAENLAPNSMEVTGKFGIILLRSGQYGKALTKLEMAANRMDDPGEILYHLGTAYMKTGDNRKAVSTFEKFIDTWYGDKEYIDKAEEIIKNLR